MSANEFRIGNLIDLPITGIEPIHTIEEDAVNYVGLHYIKLVPLTEEWLLKFGFKLDEDAGGWEDSETEKYYTLDGRSSETIRFDGRNFHWFNQTGDPYYSHDIATMQYVHQLQNLYFALTGKELEIKSPQTS